MYVLYMINFSQLATTITAVVSSLCASSAPAQFRGRRDQRKADISQAGKSYISSKVGILLVADLLVIFCHVHIIINNALLTCMLLVLLLIVTVVVPYQAA